MLVPFTITLILFWDIGLSLTYVRVKYSVEIVNDVSLKVVLKLHPEKVLFTTNEVALSSKLPSLLYSILINLGVNTEKR